MARHTETKIINGHEWVVTPWDGGYGVAIQFRAAPLLKGFFVPFLNAALSAQDNAGMKDALMEADVEAMVNALFEQIHEEKTPKLLKDMMYGAFVDGKDMGMERNFNEHFAANYSEFYQGLLFVVQVNFGDLFTMAGAIGSPGAPAEAKGANSPAT